MTVTSIRETGAPAPALPARKVVHQTQGRGHGPIVRLMSPSDLGELVKPFVFLDRFGGDMRAMVGGMPLHPHSGIATVTVFTDGDVTFDDPEAGRGTLAYGGVEWMRAGGGVWHGKEISPGESRTMQGFQLWIALPPELENALSESQYIEASAMRSVGPAHVILGAIGDVKSPVRAPEGINYLLVTLKPGERWIHTPPAGHTVAWLAIAKGSLIAGQRLSTGAMAVFESSHGPLVLQAGDDTGATFVLGTAVPHRHALHLGSYSVHTNAQALAAGEQRIRELHERLIAAGDRRTASGSTPVFR